MGSSRATDGGDALSGSASSAFWSMGTMFDDSGEILLLVSGDCGTRWTFLRHPLQQPRHLLQQNVRNVVRVQVEISGEACVLGGDGEQKDLAGCELRLLHQFILVVLRQVLPDDHKLKFTMAQKLDRVLQVRGALHHVSRGHQHSLTAAEERNVIADRKYPIVCHIQEHYSIHSTLHPRRQEKDEN